MVFALPWHKALGFWSNVNMNRNDFAVTSGAAQKRHDLCARCGKCSRSGNKFSTRIDGVSGFVARWDAVLKEESDTWPAGRWQAQALRQNERVARAFR